MIEQKQITVPLSSLHYDDKGNVRKQGQAADPTFIASIKAEGILQPLRVRPNGGSGYSVFIGGKRLAALQQLHKDGVIPADHPVPVVITGKMHDAEAREQSLTENVIRQRMHPVEEYRAFARLHNDSKNPLTEEQIAERFGISVKGVRQRLRLGELDDDVRQAWLDGKIDGEAAKAFTLCADKNEQKRLLKSCIAELKHYTTNTVIGRNLVTSKLKLDYEAPGRMLRIVGKDEYVKRGGKVTEDLFGEDHVVSDKKLLRKMVGEALDARCDQLVKVEGWKWATTDNPQGKYEYGHVQPKDGTREQETKLRQLQREFDQIQEDDEDDVRLEQLDQEIEQLRQNISATAYTAAQKAKAGCFVGIGDRGATIVVEYGRVHPDDKPKTAAEKKEVKVVSARRDGSVPQKKKTGGKTLSHALVQRLRSQMLTGTKTALTADPRNKDPLYAALASSVAEQIDTNGNYSHVPAAISRRLPQIRAGITPAVLNAHTRKAFDADDYFKNAPKLLVLDAISEAVNAGQAAKLKSSKKADVWKFALANVSKSAWVPKDLRAPGYDGPGSKRKAPAKAAKKARTKASKRS